MSAISASPIGRAPPRKREWPRRPVYLWGRVRALGCASERLLVLNLSRGGLMGETKRDLPEGRFIEVVLPGLIPAMARVAWNHDGKVGARFVRQI